MLIICTVKYNAVNGLPDYVHLHTQSEINETNIVLLDKSELCANYDRDLSNPVKTNLLIAVKTWPGNKEQRDVLRRTWIKDVKDVYHVPIIFVMGSTFDKQMVKELIAEDQEHQDMVIGKPVDNYYNLTLKAIFLLSWTRTYCSNRWLLYVDDDTIVNVKNVIELVNEKTRKLSSNSTQLQMYCHALRGYPVIRDRNSKWFVSRQVWPDSQYPDYCLGIGYLIPPNTLKPLHEASVNESTQPKLWIDDVFMGGIVTNAAGIELVEAEFKCCGHGGLDTFDKSLVMGEMGKKEDLYKKWVDIRGEEVSEEQSSTLDKSSEGSGGYAIETVGSASKVFKMDRLKEAHESTQNSNMVISPIYLIFVVFIVITLFFIKKVTNRRSKVIYRNL